MLLTPLAIDQIMTPSSGLINLLEQLTALRETFYLLGHGYTIEEHNSGRAGEKRVVGHVERGAERPCLLQVRHSTQSSPT